MKRRSESLTVILLLIVLLYAFSWNIYAEVVGTVNPVEVDETTSSEQSVEIQDAIEESVLDSFTEIDQERFMELIASGTVKTANRAGKDYYLVTEDGKYRYLGDGSAELDTFVRINGVELKIVANKSLLPENKVIKATKKIPFGETLVKYIIPYIAVCGILLLAKVAAQKALESRGVAVTKDGEEVKKETKIKGDDISIPTVRFTDVEGVEGLKADVFRLVDCLKNPDKYDAIGARTPKGVILYGPPGTGKTLLAKAIAGEAGVPFFSAVGSDFVEMYVGVGAKRVRELYKKARKSAPCIVFIDEIDAVASQRGKDSNSERDQTINALLSELDGFTSKEKIITICATNRLDMLDNAFKRAGRFDLKLAVSLPDKEGRYRILKIHSANKKLSEEVDLEKIAVQCSGFSGAELETLMNEAALTAVGKGHAVIDNDDIDDAFFKIILQGNKKPRKEISEMNRIVAWHEAGHTLATKLLTEDSVPSVTIVGSSSGAGGVTFRTPKYEGLQSKKYLRSLIGIMYAGRAAEELYQGSNELITNGASQDIQQATSIIKEYLASYGMGDLGMLDITQLRSDYGDIVEEASGLAKEIYTETLQLLMDNLEKLNALAESLLEKETLYEEDIDKILAAV